MTIFAYIARDPAGQRVEGTLAAASEQAVLAELAQRDLAPVELRPLRERRAFQRRVPVRHLANAYRQLADLLRVGMPLLQTLQLLARGKSNLRVSEVMADIAQQVEEGGRFAEAMARHEDVFPPIQVAMVRAGERGGFLEQVLARMGVFLEHQADMRSRVVGNLIYPIVLLAVGLAIIIAALVFFVPKFKDFYTRIELPLPTKVLMGSSALLTEHWLVLIAGIAGIVVLWLWLTRRPDVQRALAVAQLKVPKFGPLVASLATARFTRILGTLLENGVPMLQAMQISRDAVGHPLLGEAIDEATEAVRAGETLARPLAESGLFAEDVAEMIAVGESANNLPQVLIAIAETIEKRVDRMLNLFVRLMEPLLLLALAGVVLFIFVALIVPMLRMTATIPS